MTRAFNPIDYSSELEAAGVDKNQAAVHAKALSTVLADVVYTHDLAKVETNLRKEIQHTEKKLSTRIESVRTDLGARIDVVKASLDSKVDSVRGELKIFQKESDIRFVEVNSNIERLRMETASQFGEVNSKFAEINSRFTNMDARFTEIDARFTETNSKFYPLNVEMIIHRWALGILMAMSATTLALVVRPLLA